MLQHNHTKFDKCDERCPVWLVKHQDEQFLPEPTAEPQKFTAYLHDDYTASERREILEEGGIVLSEQAWKNFGSPFYEVGIRCEVDSKGNVTILGVE